MLPIIVLPHELLFRHSEPVTEIDAGIADFCANMVDTLHSADGIGLAAVQVAELRRIFVVHVPKDVPRVFINPEIVAVSNKLSTYEEGCLSIPGVYSDIVRPSGISVRAYGVDGNEFTLDAEGLLARVIQHEYDHLEGILFYQHLKPRQQERFLKLYGRSRGDSGAKSA